MPTLFFICDSLSGQNQYILRFLPCLALFINWGTPVYPKPEPIVLALKFLGPKKGFKALGWDVRTHIPALWLEGNLAHITTFP